MRYLPLWLCLILVTAVAAEPAAWREVQNLETSPQKKAGWAIEIPGDWMAVPVNPPAPMGMGFRDPSGAAACMVTWLAGPGGDEMASLEARGYQARDVRVGGRPGNEYARALDDGGQEKIIYVSSPQGNCRILISSHGSRFDPLIAHMLESFRFMAAGTGQELAWKSHHEGRWNLTLSMPPQWEAASGADALRLGPSGAASAVEIRLRPRKSDQSFRGYARSAGAGDVPGGSLDTFEPFTTASGETGYLALWTGKTGPVLLGYFPVGGQALVLRLLRNDQAEIFQRLVRSLTQG